jgi:prolyl oligopeptidase
MRTAIALSFFLISSCGSTPPPRAEEPIERHEQPVETTERNAGPPVAEVRPVVDRYHGTEVTDDYQWLEDPNDPDVRAWSDGQNRAARAYLAQLPHVDRIRARVREVFAAPVRMHRNLVVRGGKVFALEYRPPSEQPFIVVMDSLDAPDAARVIVDPTRIDPSGAVAIDWFVPSFDGAKIAVSLSRGGTERGDVHVFDVATGEQVHEVISHVQGGTAGGDLAWMPDGSGFYYTRYPREGERGEEDRNFYQQLYFHRLGTPEAEDRYELGRDLPRIAEIQLEMHTSGRLLATVQNGDGGEFAIFLRAPQGEWRQLCDFDDRIVQATFGPANDLYLVSRAEAPRGKILRVPVARPDVARATVVVPEGAESIVTDFWGPPTVLPTRTRLYAIYQTGGPSELRVFDLRGRPAAQRPEQPPVSAVHELVAQDGDAVLMRVASFVSPSAWLRFDGRATHATPLVETSPMDTSDWEVRREMATSRDGTEVPVNILMRRGTPLDGTAPLIATGYGGYGVNIEPRFSVTYGLYLERGMIVAVANLRGGAEFGEAWHEAGSLTHKQNVFDDFAAVLQHLIAQRYTSSERLAIMGGSNGGLLMGATMTQHPELAHAVVSFVGIYDMLRVERSPNGAFNVTEFGTVENQDHFNALYAYSPYHHVEERAYPATLFLTGANDPRVEPWHSRKMTARLQARNTADTPILLRTSDTSGHGMGTSLSEEIEEMTDVLAFVFAQLGVDVSR